MYYTFSVIVNCAEGNVKQRHEGQDDHKARRLQAPDPRRDGSAPRCDLAIVRDIEPCGVRQGFYQAVVRGLMDKSHSDYDKVQRALVKMRRDGRVPYGWIVDGTRWMHKPASYSSLEQALKRTAQTYRRAVWDEQARRVEIWLEKQGLAGTILPVTAEFDVPLYVSRGFSSLTYLAEAAEDIEAADKPTYIYHLGDHDEWGRDAGAHIERELRRLAPSADIYFERLAVTVEQIADLGPRLGRSRARASCASGSRPRTGGRRGRA